MKAVRPRAFPRRSSPAVSAAGAPSPPARRCVLAVAAALAAWMLKPPPAASNVVTRFAEWLPEDHSFTRTGRRLLALSPDGTKLVYVANQQLYFAEDERAGRDRHSRHRVESIRAGLLARQPVDCVLVRRPGELE